MTGRGAAARLAPAGIAGYPRCMDASEAHPSERTVAARNTSLSIPTLVPISVGQAKSNGANCSPRRQAPGGGGLYASPMAAFTAGRRRMYAVRQAQVSSSPDARPNAASA